MSDENHERPARPPASRPGLSRRGFIKGTGLTVAGMGLLGGARLGGQAGEASEDEPSGIPIVGPGPVPLELHVNGRRHALEAPPWATLLDVVRDRLDLTGAKRVCDRGSCGACTLIVDGRPVNSCTLLAVDAAGKSIRTIEGLGSDRSDGGERDGDDRLTPLQRAFVECDALQCGFCTPGMVLACTALLERTPRPSRAQVAEALAGNLCRCGTYPKIFEAVERVAGAADAHGGGDR